MKLNLYKRSFLSGISIFILIISIIVFPQQRKDRTETKNEARQPAVNNSSPRVEQKSETYYPAPSQPQRISESQQTQRPVVNNPAPQVEQKKQVIDEPQQRNYKPKEIERTTTTIVDPSVIHSKQVIDEPGPKEPVIKQPVREKERPTPSNIKHDQPEVINHPAVYNPEPVIHPHPHPYPYPDPCPNPTPPVIIDYDPIIEYVPDIPLPLKKISLKEQAIQDYYDEYYFDAIIDLNAAIAKDTRDFELYFWRGMAWFKLEKYDSSVVDLSRYLKVYDDDAEAYYYRGLSNFYLTNNLEAHHDFLKANKLGYQKAEDMIDKYFKDYHVL